MLSGGSFGSIFGRFVIDFGSILRILNLQKWCSRVGAVLFLRKSRFSDQIRFWIDFFMILDGFGVHFGEPFGIKIASKSLTKMHTDFGSIFDGFWLPILIHFGPILVPKIDQKSESKFEEKGATDGYPYLHEAHSPGYQKWLRGGALKSTRHKTRTDKDT